MFKNNIECIAAVALTKKPTKLSEAEYEKKYAARELQKQNEESAQPTRATNKSNKPRRDTV